MNSRTLAATNRKMVIQIACLAFVLASVVAITTAVYLSTQGGSKCVNLAAYAVIVMLAHVVSWLVFTLFLYLIYRDTVVINSPTPPIPEGDFWWYPVGGGLYRPGKPGGVGEIKATKR